jgi:glycosyltransferase involved in cell wall biosynthesis
MSSTTHRDGTRKKFRLAALTSHPIQHQAPLFQRLAAHPDVDLTVFFCRDLGVRGADFDPEFGKKIQWDIPLLDGYRSVFLKNYSPRPSGASAGQVNPGIVRALFCGRYDAVLVFGWNTVTYWLAFLAAVVTRTPVLLRGENPQNQEGFKPSWKRRVKRLVLGLLFRGVSAFLYIGVENEKFYRSFGVPDAKLFFCPYADDNERYVADAVRLKPQRETLKAAAGILPHQAVILFVGKLVEKKRPLDAIRALQGMSREAAASLVIVGDGPLRPSLEAYVREHEVQDVHFVGFRNLTELPNFYAFADILVLPSGAGETWGLVVNIAMCNRMPVVVSDVVGCGFDLVRNGANGYIFPMGDVPALSRHLEDLAGDPAKRAAFGEKSFEFVQEYSYENDVRGIVAALGRSAQRPN